MAGKINIEKQSFLVIACKAPLIYTCVDFFTWQILAEKGIGRVSLCEEDLIWVFYICSMTGKTSLFLSPSC